MKKLNNFLKYLASPAVFGLIITGLVIAIAFNYYINRDLINKNSDHSFLLKNLKRIDDKSIDLRFDSRGPRLGSPDVALLTVDEKAVQTIGRWPWPRHITGKAIENAVKLGAKVIGFDVVFSEPSDNPVLQVYERIQSKENLPANIEKAFQEELINNDSDEKFAQAMERVANNIVFGTFFENSFESRLFKSYEDICHGLMFQTTQAFQIWENDEAIIPATDPYQVFLPDILATIYSGGLAEIEKDIRDSSPEPKNIIEEVKLQSEVLSAQLGYCTGWLDPEQDAYYEVIASQWAAIKEQDEDIEADSFEEWVDYIKARTLTNSMPEATGWTMNTPQISRGGKHTGFFNAQLDMDGTIRRSRIIARTGAGHYMPSIALKSYLVANDYNAEVSFIADVENPGTKKVEKLTVTDNNTGEPVYDIPVDGEGLLQINYAGPQKMFQYVSLSDLLIDSEEMEVVQSIYNPSTGEILPDQEITVRKDEYFKGKYFILGATAIGIYDLRVTPYDENFPGAETHVNVLDNLLRQDFLRKSPEEEVRMYLVLLVIGIMMSFALTKLGAVSSILLTGSILTAIILYDKFYLFEKGIVVSIIFPLFLTSFLYVFLTFYKYFTEERNKKELRETFSKYVSPAIVDEVLSDPENIELGGSKKNITVLFSDIRGFTTISEKLDPKALSDLLNSYLTPMTDLVFENRGTLDKYMGDAVMAFFGAPIKYDDHAAHACRCSLAMLEKLKELQTMYREQGLPEIDVGIGLNSGECSVGNMGSQTVRSYTVMGDAVNLGSRLEGINKQYGTRIIISEFTYAKVKEDFYCREVDCVRVKGKIEPVHIFELVAEGKPEGPLFEKNELFKKGYELYHKKEFKAAMEQFNAALNIDAEDLCSKLYIERCQNYINEPPPADWDGVFIMTTK